MIKMKLEQELVTFHLPLLARLLLASLLAHPSAYCIV